MKQLNYIKNLRDRRTGNQTGRVLELMREEQELKERIRDARKVLMNTIEYEASDYFLVNTSSFEERGDLR